MSIVFRIMELCRFNGTTISELEKNLGYSNGSIKKSSSQTIRSDRVAEIAEHFNISPTYLLSDMNYNICPVCAFSFDPLKQDEVDMHNELHDNFLLLRVKMGYLMNSASAATKKSITLAELRNNDLSEEAIIYHYETLMMCDFTEYARQMNYSVNISYSDFIHEQIAERKYFDLIPENVVRNFARKHNVDLVITNSSLFDQIKNDKEFLQNISELWQLPQDLKFDVYKSIRHAKRDYEDSQKVII